MCASDSKIGWTPTCIYNFELCKPQIFRMYTCTSGKIWGKNVVKIRQRLEQDNCWFVCFCCIFLAYQDILVRSVNLNSISRTLPVYWNRRTEDFRCTGKKRAHKSPPPAPTE